MYASDSELRNQALRTGRCQFSADLSSAMVVSRNGMHRLSMWHYRWPGIGLKCTISRVTELIRLRFLRTARTAKLSLDLVLTKKIWLFSEEKWKFEMGGKCDSIHSISLDCINVCR